jgi:hypothetical protein
MSDETRVSFANVETKEQSKQWMHTCSPNKPKEIKEMSTCQIANGTCFLGESAFWDRKGV